MAGILFSITFPLCLVEKLDIKSNMLNDSIVLTITNALLRNTILKTLDLSYSIGGGGITIASWGSLFNLLQGSNSALENLNLSFNYITDKVVDALTTVLVINNQQQVKDLVLIVGRVIADAGWKAFSTVRCNPNSALANLDLSGNTITEQIMLSFAEALTPNKKMKEFVLGSITNARGSDGAGNNIRSDGCVAFTCILCNSSNITDTY